MKKRFALILCSLVMVCWSGMALAATVTYTFTADNTSVQTDPFTGFYLADSAGTTVLKNIADKSNTWREALTGSFEYDFRPGETYTLNWIVQNETGPMAFLGMFSVFGTTYESSSSDPWLVDGATPTSFGLLTDSNIWRSSGSSVLDPAFAGFLPEWIGYESGVNYADMLVTASFSAPVPLPGAAILFGSGLLGLVGLRRRQIV